MENSILPSVTSATWQSLVTEAKGYVLVDFWLDCSAPCRMLLKAVTKLSPAYADKCSFFAVETNSDLELTLQMRIYATPCLVLFKNGEEVDRFLGYKPDSILQAWLDEKMAG